MEGRDTSAAVSKVLTHANDTTDNESEVFEGIALKKYLHVAAVTYRTDAKFEYTVPYGLPAAMNVDLREIDNMLVCLLNIFSQCCR